MKIVLTGSSGFIGKALLRQLIIADHEVCVLLREDSDSDIGLSSKQIYYKSITDVHVSQSLSNWRPDVFFHLAWKAVSSSSRNDSDYVFYNKNLVSESINLAHRVGCTKWIGTGSQAEYGVQNKVLSEDDPCLPDTVYGTAKLHAGIDSLYKCEKLFLNGIWARIFSVYGPGDHSCAMIPYAIDKMLKNEVPEFSSGNQEWDYLYLEDAARALTSLMNTSSTGIYNVASAQPIILRNAVTDIANEIGYQGRIGWGTKPDHYLQFLAGSISKITTETGWQPEINFLEGIRRTIAHMKTSLK